jgi:hypothetical protein
MSMICTLQVLGFQKQLSSVECQRRHVVVARVSVCYRQQLEWQIDRHMINTRFVFYSQMALLNRGYGET